MYIIYISASAKEYKSLHSYLLDSVLINGMQMTYRGLSTSSVSHNIMSMHEAMLCQLCVYTFKL